jgi:hypothetical protein
MVPVSGIVPAGAAVELGPATTTTIGALVEGVPLGVVEEGAVGEGAVGEGVTVVERASDGEGRGDGVGDPDATVVVGVLRGRDVPELEIASPLDEGVAFAEGSPPATGASPPKLDQSPQPMIATETKATAPKISSRTRRSAGAAPPRGRASGSSSANWAV